VLEGKLLFLLQVLPIPLLYLSGPLGFPPINLDQSLLDLLFFSQLFLLSQFVLLSLFLLLLPPETLFITDVFAVKVFSPFIASIALAF
jgi:hypothetical protein